MSKIGNTPVVVPDGTNVTIAQAKITVDGREGSLSFDIPSTLSLEQDGNIINVKRANDERHVRAMHGFFRKLIANAVDGVNKPWEKKLEIVGTGYGATMQGEKIVLKVGYSHPVVIEKEANIKFAVEGNVVTVSGIDKQLVGQVAYKIKKVRKPDPYKGKGVRYQGEVIKLKAGKKAKA